MVPGFKKGDLVRFSEHGREAFRRADYSRQGIVANNPQLAPTRLIKVIWPGNKYGSSYHPSFLEVVDRSTPHLTLVYRAFLDNERRNKEVVAQEIDWPSLCDQVSEQFKATLAYLGEMD
jgi:hypothetical protein